MKKVTIITPPEYEGLVLESLGRAGVLHLKNVTGAEFEGLRAPLDLGVDYKELYQRVRTRLVEPIGLSDMKVERRTPDVEELRSFALQPEEKVEALINEAKVFVVKHTASQENFHSMNNKLVSELQEKLDKEKEQFEAAKTKQWTERVTLKARLESIEALQPEELKNCFAVGVVQNDIIPRINEYLKRYPETYSRATKMSEEESLLFIFGSEESRKWIEALFLVFEIKDIFDVLDPRDVILVLDPTKRQQAIKKYRAQLVELDKKHVSEDETPERVLEKGYQQRVQELKEEYEGKLKENEVKHKDEIAALQSEQAELLGRISFYTNILNALSRSSSPVLRSKVISVIQGYTPESRIPELRSIIGLVEKKVGETLFVETEEIGHEDEHAPTPPMEMPGFLAPSWILTRLRGWPSAEEFNPGYISVLIFCFQFGLMFGDIGQGLVYLLIGIALHKRFEKGMMRYLMALFIPMGMAAIVFGFMYDSFFLVEHGISNWLHSAHIELPFHYPIMPNPVHEVGELMNLIFLVGAVEVIFGALLGAFNAFKEKNYVGMLGEHGFGMGLYVLGLYLSAGSMFTEGLDVIVLVSNWPFKLMLTGMLLSFAEPVLHSLIHGHGVTIEAVGEGVGGLLMTFVEGLANLFSFLRIAAFALAHASLAGAGEAMGEAIGSGVLGLLIMNIIALSFEFISSSVQSLRLLYYEFMGKFFHGTGIPFKPFRIRAEASGS
ncbi:MAG TPA: V-type ATPase 116kDa subunit family protein [Candidatus Bathyarchaeia archaeon]